MTAWAGDFMKLWNFSTQDNERKLARLIKALLDKSVQQECDLLRLIKKGSAVANPIVRWMEEIGYPTAVTGQLATTTLTLTGDYFGVAATAANLLKCVRVGTILERESDGVQCRISSTAGISDGSPFTVTVAAHGGSSLSDDSGGVTWRIIGELWTDYKDADASRELDRTWRKVGTQIHAESFEIPKTRKNTTMELIKDEVAHQVDESLLPKLRRSLAYSVLRMKPVYSGGVPVYGDTVEESAMCGIFSWPAVVQAESANTAIYVNKSSARVVAQDIDDLVRNMWLTEHTNFKEGNWVIPVHPNLAGYIHDIGMSFRDMSQDTTKYGFKVDTFRSKIGKDFPIIPDQYMRPDVLGVVNLDKMEYGYYKNDEMDRKELATQGRYQRWLISFQTYGVVARNPRQNIGMIYGIDSD